MTNIFLLGAAALRLTSRLEHQNYERPLFHLACTKAEVFACR